ncbi:radical SAM protein [Candidatus Peregrinibacteria bacterium]|nr:radical SAM protein [Candidatus Peregrinibacteria bacterium]
MLKKILKLGRQKLWLSHREYLREKHELKYLFWECTLNCNFKCKHCGSRAGENVFKEVVSTEEIKSAFLDIATAFDANKITIAITGGEPLLRKDLLKVMKYASSLGFRWGMVSNGSLITEKVVEKAKSAGMGTVDISIDGIGEIHDEFRNTKGSYKKATNAIKLFAKADFLNPLRITTTVHHKNIDTLDEMYETFSKLGITDWRLLNVDPIGRTICNNDILLNKKQFTKLLAFMKKKRSENSKVKVTFGCAHFLGDEFEDEVRNHFFYCGTGINIGSILHNGDIFVCPNVPRNKHLIQGNIKKDSFSEIWNNKFKVYRDKDRTTCGKCKKCDFWEECLGGSFHAWDFEKKQPKVCFMEKDLYLK